MKRLACCVIATAIVASPIVAEPVASRAALTHAFNENQSRRRLLMLLSPT